MPPYVPKPPRRRLPSVILLSCLILILVAACALLALAGSLFSFLIPQSQPVALPPTSTPVPTLPPLKVYRVVGKSTMNAQFINNVLDYYGSPASGKGQALHDYGVKYGIDPAYAMAFFLEESNFGTKGVAVTTHALGNIRANPGESQYKGYRLYRTWEQGFEDWYRLIAKKYVGEWHLTTVDHIVPIYAPAEDNNDQQQYIRTVKIAIERWRNGYLDI
jgi:Mannosyl-glycoprotein endo-beta-N-acetylglucosaminidase